MAFSRDLSDTKETLHRQSCLHLEDVLSPDFTDILRSYHTRIASNSLQEIEEWYIPGKKRQYLFEFPSMGFLQQFRQGLSEITGERHDDITIGERHIKVYLENAPEYPAPHMDRQAAQFTIGFPIHIPEASRVCFFPHLSREENTGERAKYFDASADMDMARFYDDDRIVKARGKLGDMFIFHGSTIYHERIRSAGSIILYVKINAAGRDPLGEHASLLQSLTGDMETAAADHITA